VDDELNIKICDFGFSRQKKSQNTMSMTMNCQGTLFWILGLNEVIYHAETAIEYEYDWGSFNIQST
jgi:hypothetical protein